MPGRDEFATCPRCRSALDAAGARWVCQQCQGVLVGRPRSSEIIADIVGNVVSAFGLIDRANRAHVTCRRVTSPSGWIACGRG